MGFWIPLLVYPSWSAHNRSSLGRPCCALWISSNDEVILKHERHNANSELPTNLALLMDRRRAYSVHHCAVVLDIEQSFVVGVWLQSETTFLQSPVLEEPAANQRDAFGHDDVVCK